MEAQFFFLVHNSRILISIFFKHGFFQATNSAESCRHMYFCYILIHIHKSVKEFSIKNEVQRAGLDEVGVTLKKCIKSVEFFFSNK